MPELPEVETVVKDLQSLVQNKKITAIYEYRKNIFKQPLQKLENFFLQKKILDVFRYGKYILFDIQGDYFLATHLRMTGKFIFPAIAKNPYYRVAFILDNSKRLAFHDVRCFGTIEIIAKKDSFVAVKKLGVDALKIQHKKLFVLLKNKKKKLKNFLIDQQQIAGIGNIYACEILHRCGLSPFRLTNSLNEQEVQHLSKNIKKILKLAIVCNGTSISDYQRVDNKTGKFQNFLMVYKKQGCPCQTCGQKIERKKEAQSTFYCPNCQKN